MRRLLDLLARRTPTSAVFDAPLAPDTPLAVVGDVHGRLDLLDLLLGHLEAVAPDHRIILVGDLVDRGEDSAGVLRRLIGRPDITCLRGNHEAMCLGFLDNPEREGRRWLGNGGLQTLASFDLRGLSLQPGPEALRQMRDRLAEAMGSAMIDWLRNLPVIFQDGNIAVIHAGADPLVSLEEQEESSLLWGHPRFGTVPRGDGIWVVHGHVIQAEPLAKAGRIAVDTGAYATGRLTAALIGAGEVRFLST